jgi:hypothetical protein
MFNSQNTKIIALAIAFFICMMGVGLLGWGIVAVGGVELLKWILVGLAFFLFIGAYGWFILHLG